MVTTKPTTSMITTTTTNDGGDADGADDDDDDDDDDNNSAILKFDGNHHPLAQTVRVSGRKHTCTAVGLDGRVQEKKPKTQNNSNSLTSDS